MAATDFSRALDPRKIIGSLNQLQGLQDAPIQREAAQIRLRQARRNEELQKQQQEQHSAAVETIDASKGQPGFNVYTGGSNYKGSYMDAINTSQRMQAYNGPIQEALNDVRQHQTAMGLSNEAKQDFEDSLKLKSGKGWDSFYNFVMDSRKSVGTARAARQVESTASNVARQSLGDPAFAAQFLLDPNVSKETKLRLTSLQAQLAQLQSGEAVSRGSLAGTDKATKKAAAIGSELLKQQSEGKEIVVDEKSRETLSGLEASADLRHQLSESQKAQKRGAINSDINSIVAQQANQLQDLVFDGRNIVTSATPGNFTIDIPGSKNVQATASMFGGEPSNVTAPIQTSMTDMSVYGLPEMGEKAFTQVSDTFQIAPTKDGQFATTMFGKLQDADVLRQHIQAQILRNSKFGNVTTADDTAQTMNQVVKDADFLRNKVIEIQEKVDPDRQLLLDRVLNHLDLLESQVFPKGRKKRTEKVARVGFPDGFSRPIGIGGFVLPSDRRGKGSKVAKSVASDIEAIFQARALLGQALSTPSNTGNLSTELIDGNAQ